MNAKDFRSSIYSEEYTVLIDWLITKRKEANLTQRQLADRLGVIYSMVGKIENKERKLDIMELLAYCEALDTNHNEIISIIAEIKLKHIQARV